MKSTKRPPHCACCASAMIWTVDKRKKGGGEWRCAIKRRLSQRRYNAKRYATNQLYRTKDVVRLRRTRRLLAIANGEQQLRQLKATRGEPFETVDGI